jgi:hypothetical protein
MAIEISAISTVELERLLEMGERRLAVRRERGDEREAERIKEQRRDERHRRRDEEETEGRGAGHHPSANALRSSS